MSDRTRSVAVAVAQAVAEAARHAGVCHPGLATAST